MTTPTLLGELPVPRRPLSEPLHRSAFGGSHRRGCNVSSLRHDQRSLQRSSWTSSRKGCRARCIHDQEPSCPWTQTGVRHRLRQREMSALSLKHIDQQARAGPARNARGKRPGKPPSVSTWPGRNANRLFPTVRPRACGRSSMRAWLRLACRSMHSSPAPYLAARHLVRADSLRLTRKARRSCSPRLPVSMTVSKRPWRTTTDKPRQRPRSPVVTPNCQRSARC